MSIYTLRFISEWRKSIREHGFRGFLKEKGWKFILGLVLFYLVRDVTLYIILPYLVFNNVITCH